MRLQHDDPTADWSVPGVYEVDAGLYRIPLPLPHDSLRAVNVYAADVAFRLRWTRRERRFDELDLFNRCLAVSETLAHLDVLAAAGRLRRSDTDGTSHYARA